MEWANKLHTFKAMLELCIWFSAQPWLPGIGQPNAECRANNKASKDTQGSMAPDRMEISLKSVADQAGSFPLGGDHFQRISTPL